MIAYGIGVLPLIRELQDAHPCVTQTWYADDARAGEDVLAGAGALPGYAGAGISPGLLTRANHNNLGRGPRERRTD